MPGSLESSLISFSKDMEKKYLVFIVTASLVFAVGLGSGLMISRQGSIDYSKDWKFESAGFRMPLGKEITGRIKEIKSDSLVQLYSMILISPYYLYVK
jgi:hypothetical protein